MDFYLFCYQNGCYDEIPLTSRTTVYNSITTSIRSKLTTDFGYYVFDSNDPKAPLNPTIIARRRFITQYKDSAILKFLKEQAKDKKNQNIEETENTIANSEEELNEDGTLVQPHTETAVKNREKQQEPKLENIINHYRISPIDSENVLK